MIEIKVPATSANLGPGFDSIGIAWKIYNTFTFVKKKKGLNFKLTYRGNTLDLSLSENYIYSALKKLFAETGNKLEGVEVRAELTIPLARGLGSSATAILAGLSGGNFLLDNPLSEEELLSLAIDIEGHPDNIVPAFYGGFVINVMDGNKLIKERVEVSNELKIILVIPDFKLSTSRLREVLPDKVDFSDSVFNHSRTALLTSCIINKNWNNLKCAMQDKLHQNYRSRLIPGFNEVLNTAYKKGACGVALSGAGPTVMALATGNTEEIGQAMVNVFANKNVSSQYIITEPDNKGLMIKRGC